MNDLTASSEYDVDDSVYVYEEISGDPQAGTLQSSREVSGGGKMQGSQTISSASLTASSSFQGDFGSVRSSASISPERLDASQSVSITGSGAGASISGWQKYLGGWAYTGQIVSTASGAISADQRLSLGRSIYSTQSYQADGISPLACGYALVDLPKRSSSESQGAIISAAAGWDGSTSGYMGAEVVVDPSKSNIDPVAYGRNMASQGDSNALVVAAAADRKESWANSQFANFNSLCGQAAIAIAGAAGTGSRVSVDYIEARTDGESSRAFIENGRAKGGSMAIVGTGAVNLDSNIEIGTMTYLPVVLVGPTRAAQSWPGIVITRPNTTWPDSVKSSMEYSIERASLQGAVAGAAAAGEKSAVRAVYAEAKTDGWSASAWGDGLSARSDGLAAAGAASGSMDRESIDSRYRGLDYFYGYSYRDSYSQNDLLSLRGSLSAALGAGEGSYASAGSAGAGASGGWAGSFAHDARAKSDGMAAVVSAAGDLQKSTSSFSSDGADYSYWNYNKGSYAGGTMTVAAGSGTGSRASSDFIAAGTDGAGSSSLAEGLKSKGDSFAVVAAGAGKIRSQEGGSGYMQQGSGASSTYIFRDYYAIAVGALDFGPNSRASAQTAASETHENGASAFVENVQSGPGGFGFFSVASPSWNNLWPLDLPIGWARLEVFE